MKKISILLLVLITSICLFAGDALNHPFVEYSTTYPADWQSNPESWVLDTGYVPYSVYTNPLNPLSNLECGAQTGAQTGQKGYIMHNTGNPGSNYDVYAAMDEANNHLYVGVRVYDDVISPRVDGAAAYRQDCVQLRMDWINNSMKDDVVDGSTANMGVKWFDDPNHTYTATKVRPLGPSIYYSTTIDYITETETYQSWDEDSSDDYDAIFANLFTSPFYNHFMDICDGGYYATYKFDLDADLGSENTWADLYEKTGLTPDWTSIGMNIVVKDHDGQFEWNNDNERTWSSGLHAMDYTPMYGAIGEYITSWSSGHGGTYNGCVTQSAFMSIEKPERRPEVSVSTDGSIITLSWDAITDASGYRIYKSSKWDPAFSLSGVGGQGQYLDKDGNSVYHHYYLPNGNKIGVNPNLKGTGTPYTGANGFVGSTNWDLVGYQNVTAKTFNISNDLGGADEYYFLVTSCFGGDPAETGSEDYTREYYMPSKVVGYKEYSLQEHSDKTSLNFVGLPFDPGVNNASELGDMINEYASVNVITKWDETLQGWESAIYIDGFGWINDFAIEQNDALMIGSMTDDSFYNCGVINTFPRYQLENSIAAVVPLNYEQLGDYYTFAENDFIDFTGSMYDGPGFDYVEQASFWNNTAQGWVTITEGDSGSLPDGLNGSPVFFQMVSGQETTWPIYDNNPGVDAQYGME